MSLRSSVIQSNLPASRAHLSVRQTKGHVQASCTSFLAWNKKCKECREYSKCGLKASKLFRSYAWSRIIDVSVQRRNAEDCGMRAPWVHWP